jgi:hypothetical protein
MEFSTLLVARTETSPTSLWGDLPLGARLVVIVAATRVDLTDYLIAYGIDPRRLDPANNTPVFERLLPIDGLGEFFRYLINGESREAGDAAAIAADPLLTELAQRGRVIGNSVDISNPPTPTPGPKVAVLFAYAGSITTDTSLAELGGTETAAAA